jgi:hypothetical protein
VTNDRPWRLADLSFAQWGNGRERATINGVEIEKRRRVRQRCERIFPGFQYPLAGHN